MFSTTTTEESTNIPIPMASPPRVMRFPLIPRISITIKARRRVKGSEAITMRDALKFPSKNAVTIETSRIPLNSAF